MNEAKRQKLEDKGWKVTAVAEFLGLSTKEEAVIELLVESSSKRESTEESCQRS